MASFLTKSGLPKPTAALYQQQAQRITSPPIQQQQGLIHLNSKPHAYQPRILTSPSQAKFANQPQNFQTIKMIENRNSKNNLGEITVNQRQTIGLPHLQNNQIRMSHTPSVQQSQYSASSLQPHPQLHQLQLSQPLQHPQKQSIINLQSNTSREHRQHNTVSTQNPIVQPTQSKVYTNNGENLVETHMETVRQFQNLVNDIKGLVHQQQRPQSDTIVVHEQIKEVQQHIRYHPTPLQPQPQSQSQFTSHHTQPLQSPVEFPPQSQVRQHQPQEQHTQIAPELLLIPNLPTEQPPPYTIIQSNHHKFYNTSHALTNQFEQMFQDDPEPQSFSHQHGNHQPLEPQYTAEEFNELQYQQQLEEHNRSRQNGNQVYFQQQGHQIVFRSPIEEPKSPTFEQQYEQEYQQYQHQYQDQSQSQSQYQSHYQQQQQYQKQYSLQQYEQQYAHPSYDQPHTSHSPTPPRKAYEISELKQIVFGDQPFEQIDLQPNHSLAQQPPYSLSDRNPYNIPVSSSHPSEQPTHKFYQVENKDIPQQLLEYQAEQRQNEYAQSQRLQIIQTINNEIEQEKRESHSKRESHNTRNPNFMMYLDGVDLLSYYDLHQKLLNDKDELAALYQQSFGLDAK